MRRAIELGTQNPLLPFGALIVDRVAGEILAEGFVFGTCHPFDVFFALFCRP
jgi:hypothetical protein